MTIKAKKDFIINVFFTITVVLIVYFTIKFALGYLFPFVIGVLLSFIMQRPAEIVSKKFNIKKSICNMVFVAFAFVAIIGLIILLIFAVMGFANYLIDRLPQITDKLDLIVSNFKNTISESFEMGDRKASLFQGELLDNLINELTVFLSGIAKTAAKNIPKIIVGTLVTVVASLYISKDYSRLKKFFMGLLSEQYQKNLLVIKDIITGSILKFLTGYLMLSILTFFELMLLLFIIGIKNFISVAIIIAVIDFLPIFGSGTVLIPWAIISALSGNPSRAVAIAIIYIIITIVRNFAEPHIIGEKIGVNPLIMLITLFVGLRLAGFLGMLALPIAVIVFFKYYELQLKQ